VEFIRAPEPAYPMMSRRLGEQGKVMIRALVDEQGHAVDVAIQQSSGKPRLDEAAKKAVMGALFKPYREEGRPEQVYVIVPVIFKMET
jgi:protein TonB